MRPEIYDEAYKTSMPIYSKVYLQSTFLWTQNILNYDCIDATKYVYI